MRSIFILFITLFSLITLQSRGQSAAEVLQQANAAYAKAENISMNIQYRLYSNYASQTPYETNDGKYIRQGGSYYSSLLGITTVQNKKYMISVSDNDQTMIVSNPVKIAKSPSVIETDSVLKGCSSTEVKKNQDGSKLCILRFESVAFSEFDRIEIEVGTAGFITHMVLYYREAISLDETNPDLKKDKPRLEIIYSNIVVNPVIKADQFSEKPFIIDNGKQIIAAPAYSKYRILNHKQ